MGRLALPPMGSLPVYALLRPSVWKFHADDNPCVFLGNEGDSDDDLPPLERNFNHPEDEENEGEEEDDDSDVSEDEVDEEEQEVGNKCGDASEQKDSPVKNMVFHEEQGLETMLTKSSLNDWWLFTIQICKT